MSNSKLFYLFMMTGILLSTRNSEGLDLLPKGARDATQEMKTHYWIMSTGNPVGFKIDIEINGSSVGSMKEPGETLEVTPHVHAGLNTIRFISKENKRKNATFPPGSGMTITLGPESSREKQGTFSRMFIQLKENIVHFTRPAAYRSDESQVEVNFSLRETPNPELKTRYVLYAQGEFSGHVVHVALNGVPFMDVAGPGTHLDINPYLETGKNEVTFSSSRMENVPFTEAEREALKGKVFEVGIAAVGAFDSAAYDQPVTQVSTFLARYNQPADREEPEETEKATINAE